MDDTEGGAVALLENVGRVEPRGGVRADTQRDTRGNTLLLLLGGAHDLRQ